MSLVLQVRVAKLDRLLPACLQETPKKIHLPPGRSHSDSSKISAPSAIRNGNTDSPRVERLQIGALAALNHLTTHLIPETIEQLLSQTTPLFSAHKTLHDTGPVSS